jgi:AraC-like DNA-binding protein
MITPGKLLFETDTPVFMMMFCLDGFLEFSCIKKDCKIILHSQKCIYLSIPACSVESKLEELCKFLIIFLTKKCYHRLISDHLFIQDGTITDISPIIQLILNSLIDCRYTNTMKRIFMETQVLHLLLLQLERQKPVIIHGLEPFLREYDIRKIVEARSLIEENLKTPCSLIELAHKVGLNDFKLKKGFKEIFGTTVFGLLYELRMREAKRLLTEEKRLVSYVSSEVGYKNSHHFSAAFKKRYGILPSLLNK